MNTLAWRYVGHCVEGERFLIDGVDVSDRVWRPTNEPTVEIEDPHDHRPGSFQVWEVQSDGGPVRFAAGEVSNCVWGFFKKV